MPQRSLGFGFEAVAEAVPEQTAWPVDLRVYPGGMAPEEWAAVEDSRTAKPVPLPVDAEPPGATKHPTV